MSFKDLVVHLDQSAACTPRIALAIELAERFEAHVTGFFPAAEPPWPIELHTHMVGDLMEDQRREIQAAGQAQVAAFTAQALAAGVSAEGVLEPCLEAELGDALATRARVSDLLLLGQPQDGDPTALAQSIMESVLFSSGGPVLLVPWVGVERPAGERVMVAWDGSVEAARSVKDALPFLRRADSVVVLSVDPRSSPPEAGADVALFLSRHGCRVEVQQVVSGTTSVGDTILSRLADLGIDLLIMGAYGHSRLREMVLGGVTRRLLAHMTVPVLMSH